MRGRALVGMALVGAACTELRVVRPTHHPVAPAPAAADSGAADSGGDSGGGAAWRALPEDCAGAAAGVAPVAEEGAVFLQDHVFAEVLDVVVDGGRGLALAVGQGGLMVVDLADPSAPRFRGANAPGDGQREHQIVRGEGTLAYTTHRDFGLHVWETADPGRPARVGRVAGAGFAGLERAGGHLYVAHLDGALHTFSLADPRAPVRVAEAGGLGNPRQPLVVGDALYVADHAGELHRFSLADPAAPARTGGLALPAGGLDLAAAAEGAALYVAMGAAGVAVVAPGADGGALRGVLDVRHAAISVAVDGAVLWVATQQDVVAFDVREPLAPRPIGGWTTGQWAMAVAAGGGRAVVGDWGWLRTVTADVDAAAPDVLVQSRALSFAPEGGEAVVELANLGGGALRLLGAASTDPRLALAVDGETVGAGAAGRLRVAYAGGGGLDATVCVGTDDPDEPTLSLRAVDGASGGDALGQPAPDFTLDSLDGERLTLSEQAGFPVVLVYFATW